MTVVVHLGFLITVLGLVSVAKPIALLGIRSRVAAGLVLAVGLALVTIAALWPAPRPRMGESELQIAQFLPRYQFNEVHSIRVEAPPERVIDAIKTVTPQEIRFLRILFGIRRLPGRLVGRVEPRAPETKPFLSFEDSSSSLILAQTEREIVVGIVGRFWAAAGDDPPRPIDTSDAFLAFSLPGYAKAAMNFLVEEEDGGWCRLTTETRVLATDPVAARRFAPYWRVIYPGSSLLRVTFLKAVKRRAEQSGRNGGAVPAEVDTESAVLD